MDADNKKLMNYIRTFIVPTLALKAAVLYFGIQYSLNPDEGYGWGLLVSIVLTLTNFAIFLYKNWNEIEE